MSVQQRLQPHRCRARRAAVSRRQSRPMASAPGGLHRGARDQLRKSVSGRRARAARVSSGTWHRFISKISRSHAHVRSATHAAWDHFVLEMRPGLYRAADALDRSGGARELADSLYADLYGVEQRGGARQSLFRYFHGRSSLATWLRAVLAQRHVDRVRVERRIDPLPEELPARHVADTSRSRLRALCRAASHGARDRAGRARCRAIAFGSGVTTLSS